MVSLHSVNHALRYFALDLGGSLIFLQLVVPH